MLPLSRLVWRAVDGEVVPGWLTEADDPWLRDLLDAYRAADGERRRSMELRLVEAPRQAVPTPRVRMASHVLIGRLEARKLPVPPRRIRALAFAQAQQARGSGDVDRGRILRAVEAELGVDPEAALFADIPAEREVAVPRPLPTPAALREEVNLALAQGLVRRALHVEIDLDGGARDIVRAVQLRRLLCVATRRPDGGTRLAISGVRALFRRTTLYGRALASLVPRLAWSGRFALRARCLLDDQELLLRLGPEDRLKPSRPPRRYDSHLEEQFAADFLRTAPDWRLVREPEAVGIGTSLVFPDFALERHGRRWLVEIVGFWTPDYLHRKLETLRGTGVLLCIDERLACGEEDAADLPVVWFRRRIDPAAVLDALCHLEPAAGGDVRVGRPGMPSGGVRVDRLGLPSYFIDYAGRIPGGDPVHQRLGDLRVGSQLTLEPRGGYCYLCSDGGPVAALSARARETWTERAGRVRWVRVVGLASRHRDQSGPAYRHRLRVDRWVVPLVEVGWAP